MQVDLNHKEIVGLAIAVFAENDKDDKESEIESDTVSRIDSDDDMSYGTDATDSDMENEDDDTI